jgi:hypothetical protein
MVVSQYHKKEVNSWIVGQTEPGSAPLLQGWTSSERPATGAAWATGPAWANRVVVQRVIHDAVDERRGEDAKASSMLAGYASRL